MALLASPLRRAGLWLAAFALVLVACSSPESEDTAAQEPDSSQLFDTPRRYNAEWLIDLRAVNREDIATTTIYREVTDDATGTYLVESPTHLALQTTDEVVLCAAVSRIPLDPFCASSPRADGAPNVLAFPLQLIRGDWGPAGLYDLAGYREVSLVAASAPDDWVRQTTTATAGFAIECFLVVGDSPAATTGFEICYTDDDLHLVASVDLQNDLLFEIELLSYERELEDDDFVTGFEDFVEARPELQDQLLDLYPEIPAARPTPAPDLDG